MLAVQQFDEYCERVGFSLLAEPINAISNLAFIVAAWAAWRLAKRTGTHPTGVKVLIALAGSTAIGSMLWHTLANTWSLYLDVIPIALFMVGVLWIYVRNVMGKGTGFAALSVGAFLCFSPLGAANRRGYSRRALLFAGLAPCICPRPVSRHTAETLPLHAPRGRGYVLRGALLSND